MTVELVLLSPVAYGGREITSARIRSLLALLATDLRGGCGIGPLVDGLWPDERPENPVKALQVLVSRARAQLGPDVIASTPTGYRLALNGQFIDAEAVRIEAEASVRAARKGDPAAALMHAEAGLALWTTAPGSEGHPADPLATLRAARIPAYRALVRSRALALAHLARRSEAVEPLTALAREHPRDEEILAELLRCEAAVLGPATALARYDAYRRTLRDDLGADPGGELRRIHEQLLRDAAPPVRHGVPHEPNPLLGRADDVAAVTALLRTSRVVSIVGAGGLGKTRLAQVVSRAAEQRLVLLVPLAGVSEAGGVATEVASALGIGPSTDVLAGIIDALGPGPALLVLDNCEQVIDGVAELVHALVARRSDLRILTTSRTPLGLSSEAVYLLPELSLATAVELFTQRARAARSAVDLPAEAVREVCGHLDGLPLAVELAAARVRVMTVEELAHRLDDRLGLLRGGARDAPRRHRTLHAVIDWSWHLLEPDGQAAMRALSVFPGGFTASAAAYLLEAADALPVLEQLVDQSLIKLTEDASGARFRMLETVREFSSAQREQTGGTDATVERFLAWARDFALAHHADIFGAGLVACVQRVRSEQDNLAFALRLGLDRADGATVAATSAVLGAFWTAESNFSRMAMLAREPAWALSHYRPAPAMVEPTRTASLLAVLASYLLLGPPPLRPLATLRRLPSGPPDTPIRAAETVLRSDAAGILVLCGSENLLVAAIANHAASYLLENTGDLAGALLAARRMLAAASGNGNLWLQTLARARLGELCLETDLGDEARHHLAATLDALESLGAWSSATRVRWVIVLTNLRCGDFGEAERWLELTVGTGHEATGLTLFDVAVRAELRIARGDVESGLRLWRLAADRLPDVPSGALDGDFPGFESWVLEARAVTVVAHAQHHRLNLVEGLVKNLVPTLTGALSQRSVGNSACGALVLALGMVRLERDGDASGVRLLALAERLRFARGFQPTMSPARIASIAEQADRSAYSDALSEYADLDQDALRAAALDSAHRVALEQRP